MKKRNKNIIQQKGIKQMTKMKNNEKKIEVKRKNEHCQKKKDESDKKFFFSCYYRTIIWRTVKRKKKT